MFPTCFENFIRIKQHLYISEVICVNCATLFLYFLLIILSSFVKGFWLLCSTLLVGELRKLLIKLYKDNHYGEKKLDFR